MSLKGGAYNSFEDPSKLVQFGTFENLSKPHLYTIDTEVMEKDDNMSGFDAS